MNMRQFQELADKGYCPSCHGRNLMKKQTNSAGLKVLICRDCGGKPILCANTGSIFIDYDINNVARYCKICGEDMDIRNHTAAFL